MSARFSGYVVGAGYRKETEQGSASSTLDLTYFGAVDTNKPENKVNF